MVRLTCPLLAIRIPVRHFTPLAQARPRFYILAQGQRHGLSFWYRWTERKSPCFWRLMILGILLCLCGCRKTALNGDHPRELVGIWQMLIRSDCKDLGLKSENLELHPDGTFDQHVTAVDGRHVDVKGEHWKFVPNHSIQFNRRHDFLILQTGSSLWGSPQDEVLTLELGSPPVVLINPPSDCVYQKIN